MRTFTLHSQCISDTCTFRSTRAIIIMCIWVSVWMHSDQWTSNYRCGKSKESFIRFSSSSFCCWVCSYNILQSEKVIASLHRIHAWGECIIRFFLLLLLLLLNNMRQHLTWSKVIFECNAFTLQLRIKGRPREINVYRLIINHSLHVNAFDRSRMETKMKANNYHLSNRLKTALFLLVLIMHPFAWLSRWCKSASNSMHVFWTAKKKPSVYIIHPHVVFFFM